MTDSTTITPQELMELRNFITLSHHEPGNIRLKVDPRILSHPIAKKGSFLSGKSNADSGLINSSINIITRTVTLEYDTGKIAPDALNEFLTGTDEASAVAAGRQVAELFGFAVESA